MRRLFLLFVLMGVVGTAVAQPAAEFKRISEEAPGFSNRAAVAADAAQLHYVVRQEATLYFEPDPTLPYRKLRLRETVRVVDERGGWLKVQRADGTQGYVRPDVVSNVWLKVSKSNKMVYLYRGSELVKRMPADFGYSINGDKTQRGSSSAPEHWRTPEGVFYICRKNDRSQFYKALVLSYPSPVHAERGLKEGLISRRQYDEIVRAAATYDEPPMNTALGGLIEIHGFGTGGRNNWTKGCVALRDIHMDDLWAFVEVGTPVVIEP